MRLTRRKFMVAGGLALGGLATASGWLAVSSSRLARWLRQMIGDTPRALAPPPLKPDHDTWVAGDVTACWLGHATVLLRFLEALRHEPDRVAWRRIGESWQLG